MRETLPSAQEVQDEYCTAEQVRAETATETRVHDECFGDWLRAHRERGRSSSCDTAP